MSDPGPNKTIKIVLDSIPQHFKDDGCSGAPDGLLGRDIRWCCRIHDWRYCSRAHNPGSMNQTARTYADKELGWNVRGVLPFTLRWLGWLYWLATHRWGGTKAWNSCGPSRGERCRHNLLKPEWMRK